MYQITKVEPKTLSKVKVQHQDRIIQLTGKRLEPKGAFDIIKDETGGFKKKSEKAKQADKLLIQLLRLNGVVLKGGGSAERERILIEARARERATALLELELEFAA